MRPRTLKNMREDASAIFRDALEAVSPEAAVQRHMSVTENQITIGDVAIDLSDVDKLFVIGAGKASAAMATAIESLFPNRLSQGFISVKYGHTVPLKHIHLMEAGHPVPDENGLIGSEEILSIASRAGARDLIICLVSGGGSALLPMPAPGITLAQKQVTTRALLACGATIHEINAVRKHLSAAKGGQLAKAAFPARLITLILSDVVGDDLDVIASGPTVPDKSTYGDCMAIVGKYHLQNKLPEAVLSRLQAGMTGQIPETPKPGDACFSNTFNVVVGSNRDAVIEACRSARELGYSPIVLSTMIQGETREAARFHTAIAKEALKNGNPINPPACILSGGETTVTIKGAGKGGRNQEFALAAALDIEGLGDMVVFSAGTDGTDGPTDAAGAIVDPNTVSRATGMGMDPIAYLNNNDSHSFFKKLDDLFITGPTNTNVMDLRIMLIA